MANPNTNAVLGFHLPLTPTETEEVTPTEEVLPRGWRVLNSDRITVHSSLFTHHSIDVDPDFDFALTTFGFQTRLIGRLSRTPPTHRERLRPIGTRGYGRRWSRTTPSLAALLDENAEKVRQTKEEYFRIMDARRARDEDLRLGRGEDLSLCIFGKRSFTVHLLYKHEYCRLRGIELSKGNEPPPHKKLVAFNTTCPICLEDIASDEGRFASCGRHTMHANCFDRYSLAYHTQKCPMCRD